MAFVRYCLIVFLTLVSFAAHAKENKDLVRAEFYYAHLAYYEAIPFFEKVAPTLNDPVVYTKLADCYSATGSMQKASDAYAKAVSTPGCSKTVLLRHAQVLMQLMQYNEAGKWLKEYLAAFPADRRAANLSAGCNTAAAATSGIPPGVVSLLPFNTDGSDFAPTLWKGQLVFASDTVIDLKKKTDRWTGKAYYSIYSINCDGHGHCDTAFNKLADTKEVNIKYHNGPATFSSDGKQMYYTRSRFNDNFFSKRSVTNKDSIVLLEIMMASDFDTAKKKFRDITPFQHNNESYSVAHPSLSPDGKVLAFSSNMPKGRGGSDIYFCKKMGNSWSRPVNAGAVVNTEGEEVFPYWADNSTLFFSSDGQKGIGGLDIYKCNWDDKTGIFSDPENAGVPVNSSFDDITLAPNASGGSCYLSSNRPAVKGGDNIYFYRKAGIFLQLTVVDSATRQPLANTKISLEADKDRKNAETGVNGQYFTRLYPTEIYAITVNKESYPSKQLGVTATSHKETDTIFRTIELVKPVRRDTMSSLPPLTVKTRNVMDTPGIQVFEQGEVYQIGRFHYAYDKYELTAAHKVFLDTMMTMLQRHPTMRIQVRSHTDCRGSVAYNEVLSKNRALSVVNYLIKNGIAASRLEYVGLGGTDPIIPCPDCLLCTEEEHYLNRVLDFKVLRL